jgi:hypothetical protein
MQTKDSIRFALNVSHNVVLGAIDRMRDSPTTFPTPNGGCHPLWVLGYLAFVEGMIPEALFGERNSVTIWSELFGPGSTPVSEPDAYPAFAEVRAKYVQLRERNLGVLDSLNDDELERPTLAPPRGLEREWATFGSSFLALALPSDDASWPSHGRDPRSRDVANRSHAGGRHDDDRLDAR